MKPITLRSLIGNFSVMDEKKSMMISGLKKWQEENIHEFPDVSNYDLYFEFTEMPYFEAGKRFDTITEITLTVHDKSNVPFRDKEGFIIGWQPEKRIIV